MLGMKNCSNIPGHMTNMTFGSIYGKNSRISFLGTKRSVTMKLGIQHRVLRYFQMCSNDDPRLTLIMFMTVEFLHG